MEEHERHNFKRNLYTLRRMSLMDRAIKTDEEM